MSARDLCRDCRIERATIPADQMAAKSGPAYDRWCEAMIRLAGQLATSQ